MIAAGYQRLLSTHPFTTQCLTTGFLFGTGDCIAQAIESNSSKDTSSSTSSRWDWARTCRMTGYGGLFSGPAMVWWYRFLNSKINWINQPLTTLTARVAADQLIFAPTFIGLFFINQGLMAGKSTNEIQKKLIDTYPATLLDNYKLWPAVQFINFYFVPLNHRVLVVSTIALGWNSYLSLQHNKSSNSSNPQSPPPPPPPHTPSL